MALVHAASMCEARSSIVCFEGFATPSAQGCFWAARGGMRRCAPCSARHVFAPLLSLPVQSLHERVGLGSPWAAEVLSSKQSQCSASHSS